MRRFLVRAVRNAAVAPVVRRQYQPVSIVALQQRFSSTESTTAPASIPVKPVEIRASTADHHAQFLSNLKANEARKACTEFEQLRKSKNLSLMTTEDLQSLIKLIQTACKSAQATQGQKSFMAACAENAFNLLLTLDPVAAKTHSMIFGMLRIQSFCRRSGAVNSLIKEILSADFKCSRDDYFSLIRACIDINSLDNALTLYSKMIKTHRPNIGAFDLYLQLCERASRKLLSRLTSEEEKAKLRAGIDLQQLAQLEEMFERELNSNQGAAERRLDQMVLTYAAGGDLEKTQQLLTALVGARNQPPQLSTYGALISAYDLNGRSDLALQTFQEVQRYYGEDQMPKLSFNLIPIVRTLVEAGQTDKALQAIDWFMQSAGTNYSILHNNLPMFMEILKGENQPAEVQQKLAEMQEKLSSIRSDETQMKEINERSFDYRAANNKLQESIASGNVDSAMEAFDRFATAGKYPDMETSEKLCTLLASRKRVDGLGKMIRANQRFAPYGLSKTYFETLISTGNLADAWLFYRTTFRDKSKYDLPTIGSYSRVIQAFVNGQKVEWAAELLTDLENASKNRREKYAVWRPPFQSGVYTNLMQGYTRSGQSAKAMEVFERMAATDNPLQIPPTIHTYNTVLLAFIRDWNMVAFTELCDSLSANASSPAAAVEGKRQESTDRQVTRELTKQRWEEFQRERSSSTVKIPVPSYITPNRITENLRLLGLINSNHLDKVPDAYAKSLNLSEPPSLVTFEMLAAYQLRRMGRDDFSLKSMQRPIAERCLNILKGEQMERLGVEATLSTVESCVKEFLQENEPSSEAQQ